MACKCGPYFCPANEDRVTPGLLYGMPLPGTACALRDFAHAQNHPSDGRPHANCNTCAGCLRQPPSFHPRPGSAALFRFWPGRCSSSSCCSSVSSLGVTEFILCGVVPRLRRRTGLSCCASSRCASRPFGLSSLAQGQGHRFRWPDGPRAFTVRRGRTSGQRCGHQRRWLSAGVSKGQGRSYMGDGSLREPSPIRQGIVGCAVKDKNRNPEGNPRFFPGRFGSGAGTWAKINSQYVNIAGRIRAVWL